MGTHGVGLPTDTSLPMFVYGAFRPGELAHNRLLPHLGDSRSASIGGYELRLRDGLPLLTKALGESQVRGDLLVLDEPGYEVVGGYEPKELYRWHTLRARVDGRDETVNVLRGYKPDRGVEPEPILEWHGHEDPLFGPGLAALGNEARRVVRRQHLGAPHEPDFWRRFVLLQGLYLTAWTVAERVAAMRFGPNGSPNDRIKELDAWPDAQQALAAAEPPRIEVFSAKEPENVRRFEAGRAFETWYQARSNLSHRGKAAMVDADLVRDSLIGLHDTLRLLLIDQLPGLADVWTRCSAGSTSSLKAPWLLGSTAGVLHG